MTGNYPHPPNPPLSKEDYQILFAWVFFFWLIIPAYAITGLFKIIEKMWKEEE